MVNSKKCDGKKTLHVPKTFHTHPTTKTFCNSICLDRAQIFHGSLYGESEQIQKNKMGAKKQNGHH